MERYKHSVFVTRRISGAWKSSRPRCSVSRARIQGVTSFQSPVIRSPFSWLAAIHHGVAPTGQASPRRYREVCGNIRAMKQTLNSLNEVKNQLGNLLPALRRDFNVTKIGVFGSVARNEERPDSDVDVMVSFSKSPGFFKFVRLENYLAGALKRRVDLVTRRALKPTTEKEILRHVSYV